MLEALFTALGLVLGGVATVVGLLHDEKPSIPRKVLFILASVGVAVGLITTYVQYQDRKTADKAADDARQRLTAIQDKVGDLAQVDGSVQTKMEDLTMLDKLGGGQYYVKNRLTLLYPNAEANGLLWTSPAPGSPTRYELRFGRNLTPSSAEIFLNLANQGLANGHALIRRER